MLHEIILRKLKTSSPNDFQSSFYQEYWDIIGKDVIEAILKLFKHDKNNHEINKMFNHDKDIHKINKMFITLIPKEKKYWEYNPT